MTPLADALKAHVLRGRISFHTPGHKGGFAPLSALTPAYDLTELPDTGSLYDGGDAVERAEREAADAFGTALTAFSAGGCSLCIWTMLSLAAERGRKIVMARASHRSAVNAAAYLRLEVSWLTDLTPEGVDRALTESGAQSVFLTSPDYFGRLADVAGISRVCGCRGAALLVDNAHGSHLDAFGLHPLALGADMAADSWHKTLPVLTGGACLHIAKDGLFGGTDAAALKQTMAMFGSTSPSFLVLHSMDLAREWWQREGKEAFSRLPRRLAPVFEAVRRAGLVFSPGTPTDPARVVLDCHGRDGRQAADRLREAGAEPEMADGSRVVLIPSPLHTDGQLDALARAIGEIHPQTLREAVPSPFSAEMPRRLPRRAMPLWEAVLAPHETVSARESAGRIAGVSVCPCPPGVAAVAPGEIIDDEMASRLVRAGFAGLRVVREKGR